MAKEHVDMNTPVIEMRNIVKKFGDFTANDGINLTVHKGEIHAILGENGAGHGQPHRLQIGIFHSGKLLSFVRSAQRRTLSYLDYSIIAEKQQESAESQNAKEL